MCYRLHVCKKYDVQYANIEDFNWKSEQIHHLFKHLLEMESYWWSEDDEDIGVSRDEFLEKISYLRSLPADAPHRNEILGLCAELGYPNPADLASRLKEFADAADPSNDYIHFEFF